MIISLVLTEGDSCYSLNAGVSLLPYSAASGPLGSLRCLAREDGMFVCLVSRPVDCHLPRVSFMQTAMELATDPLAGISLVESASFADEDSAVHLSELLLLMTSSRQPM